MNAVSLASDVNVKFRKVIIERFKNHELNLLLATDMVARGIDIDNLECVLNFEVPLTKKPTLIVLDVLDAWARKVLSSL